MLGCVNDAIGEGNDKQKSENAKKDIYLGIIVVTFQCA